LPFDADCYLVSLRSRVAAHVCDAWAHQHRRHLQVCPDLLCTVRLNRAQSPCFLSCSPLISGPAASGATIDEKASYSSWSHCRIALPPVTGGAQAEAHGTRVFAVCCLQTSSSVTITFHCVENGTTQFTLELPLKPPKGSFFLRFASLRSLLAFDLRSRQILALSCNSTKFVDLRADFADSDSAFRCLCVRLLTGHQKPPRDEPIKFTFTKVCAFGTDDPVVGLGTHNYSSLLRCLSGSLLNVVLVIWVWESVVLLSAQSLSDPSSRSISLCRAGGVGIAGFSVGTTPKGSEVVRNGFPTPGFYGQTWAYFALFVGLSC
jgi:hypothetical protein